jgi:hypothetical protein
MVADWDIDAHGNHFLTIGENPVTLFSAHFDTVDSHFTQSVNKAIHINNSGVASLLSDHTCLGADDGAGLWLIYEMILAEVPGMYALFQDEECGGLGGNHALDKGTGWCASIKHMVCFDRKGTGDVITHQFGGRTASNDFARALANDLYSNGLRLYTPSDAGTFCDSATFSDFIPECSNVSIGYANAHTRQETLDAVHLLKLAEACKRIRWNELPVSRDLSLRRPAPFPAWSGDTPNFSSMTYEEISDWVYGARTDEIVDALYAETRLYYNGRSD